MTGEICLNNGERLRNTDQFLVATQKSSVPDPLKVAILLRVFGIRGNDIYENFQ